MCVCVCVAILCGLSFSCWISISEACTALQFHEAERRRDNIETCNSIWETQHEIEMNVLKLSASCTTWSLKSQLAYDARDIHLKLPGCSTACQIRRQIRQRYALEHPTKYETPKSGGGLFKIGSQYRKVSTMVCSPHVQPDQEAWWCCRICWS